MMEGTAFAKERRLTSDRRIGLLEKKEEQNMNGGTKVWDTVSEKIEKPS